MRATALIEAPAADHEGLEEVEMRVRERRVEDAAVREGAQKASTLKRRPQVHQPAHQSVPPPAGAPVAHAGGR